MKVRVVFDVTLDGGRDEFHPNYVARMVDAGLRKISKTNNLLLSWETVDATEVPDAVR